MKKVVIVIVAIVCVVLFCGGFYFLQRWSDKEQKKEEQMTEFEKIVTRDMDKNYPATPREAIKFHNRIVTCCYNGDYSSDELRQLADQEEAMFDDELLANNPREEYVQSLQQDINTFHTTSDSISQTDVCDSNDVIYKTIDGDEIAYVDASYFIRQNKGGFVKTYQQFVLRKDDEGKWKILVFYKIDNPSPEDD